MRSRTAYITLCCTLALVAFTGAAYLTIKSSKDIPLTNERELKVNLQTGMGNIAISRGTGNQAVSIHVDSDDNNLNLDDCVQYDVRDKVGYLNFSTDCSPGEPRRERHRNIHIDKLDSRNWQIQLTDAVPLSFDMELGLGRGDIDLTGLSVKDFNLSCGASSVVLHFDQPNKEIIEDMNIEAGVSKFEAYGLCNARFRHFKFNGGVGSYVLDFSGPLQREVDADIEVGLGSLTIRLPNDVGAKVVYEKSWIAHLAIDKDFAESSKEENSYFSQNYYSAKGRINLRVDAGLGSVKVRRR